MRSSDQLFADIVAATTDAAQLVEAGHLALRGSRLSRRTAQRDGHIIGGSAYEVKARAWST